MTRDGWKYACFDNMSWILYNRNEDPFEMANLAHNSRYRPERRRLLQRLKQWNGDTGDKFNLPAD